MTYASIKIRSEYAAELRILASLLNIKIADALALWPRCPRCRSPLVQQEEGVAACPTCRREYALVERL